MKPDQPIKITKAVAEPKFNAKIQFSNSVAVQDMLQHNCDSLSLTLNEECVTPQEKKESHCELAKWKNKLQN